MAIIETGGCVKKKIAVVPGDGIGPEVVAEAVKVLKAVEKKFGHEFLLREALAGGAAIDAVGTPMPEDTMKLCLESDAVLLGALGAFKYDVGPFEKRPERALMRLRRELKVYINLRPAKAHNQLLHFSPFKEEKAKDVDIMIVRELTGGIYFGEPRGVSTVNGEERGVNTLAYSESEIRRILTFAFGLARKRRNTLCSVDKANILETFQLWRRIAEEMSAEYPDVQTNHLYVDNAAMQIINNPRQFDVIVTGNMFGDILSDEASTIGGSLGMMPSASIGGSIGLYEPVHGSAPDIAGRNIANPIATIKSAEMMLRYSFGMEKEADCIDQAVEAALDAGYRTRDIYREGDILLKTHEMGDRIAGYVRTH